MFRKVDRKIGFTTNELVAMESLPPLFEGGQLPDLDDVPIHPMYARKRWNMPLGKHLAPYPIRRGKEGYWEVSSFLLMS
jgi:hypothetical protein